MFEDLAEKIGSIIEGFGRRSDFKIELLADYNRGEKGHFYIYIVNDGAHDFDLSLIVDAKGRHWSVLKIDGKSIDEISEKELRNIRKNLEKKIKESKS